MCIDSDTDTLMRKRSRTRQACPNCVGGQGAMYLIILLKAWHWMVVTTTLVVLWRYHLKNLQISDDVVGHIKLNEAIRNITEIQFKSK